jgi:hypothetical protein
MSQLYEQKHLKEHRWHKFVHNNLFRNQFGFWVGMSLWTICLGARSMDLPDEETTTLDKLIEFSNFGFHYVQAKSRTKWEDDSLIECYLWVTKFSMVQTYRACPLSHAIIRWGEIIRNDTLAKVFRGVDNSPSGTILF